MDFFGIGGGEILLILIVALIIFGPGKMIEISRSLGKMMHNLKKMSSDLTQQVTREIEEADKSQSSQRRDAVARPETSHEDPGQKEVDPSEFRDRH